MDLMKEFPDKHFELAIVDPPYGIARFGDRVCASGKINKWDCAPDKKYFDELFRVSVNQIIWGANNFTLPESEYFIIWDKEQTVDNFASAEYAYTNIKKPAQIFRHSIHKEMFARRAEGGKIHPTQKPVALYKWLLHNYAKKGDKILDTHLGSMSSVIACYDEKFDITGAELDPDYFKAGMERVNKHTSQVRLDDII